MTRHIDMYFDDLPWISLSEFPTPIHRLESLSSFLGGPNLFMKRDDLTSLGFGGNKTRKLEFLVGEALKQGKDTLITAGGVQSNHCRLTAAAARRAGLDCHLVLGGEPPERPSGNLLLDKILGATVHYCDRAERNARMEALAEELTRDGKAPYVIPVGGSNAVGAVGYVKALLEMRAQTGKLGLEPDAVVFATSSGGTQAGLALGAKLTGFKGKVLGISIDQTKTGNAPFPPLLEQIANETAVRIKSDVRMKADEFSLDCNYLGAGYAVPGDLEFDAIRLLSLREAILLGPVYTARAMGGLLDLIRQGVFTKKQNVLFWHTGGGPELFAWAEHFA